MCDRALRPWRHSTIATYLSPEFVHRQVRGLEWDPFCPHNIATGGADGMVKLWSIPSDGLQADLTTPLVSLSTCE